MGAWYFNDRRTCNKSLEVSASAATPMGTPPNSWMGSLEYNILLPAVSMIAKQKPATGWDSSSSRKLSAKGTGPASISPSRTADARVLGTWLHNWMPRRSMSK